MTWITEHWVPLLVGVGLLLLVVGFLWFVNSLKARRTGKKRVTVPRNADRGQKIVVLVDALEEILYDVTDKTLPRSDCKKVAMAMLAIMAVENISLEELFSDGTVFVETAVEALTRLVESGEVTL